MSAIELKRNALRERLNEITDRAKSSKAFAGVYPLYQKLQVARFGSENTSEGERWPKLSSEYADYKKKRYKDYPGGGDKILIATSTLAGAVIGPGAQFEGTDKHRAKFKPYSFTVEVDQSGNNAEGRPFNYPQYVAEVRPFMEFKSDSIQAMKVALKQYLIGK